MLSKRYTIVLADRTTGVVRRFTIAVKPVLVAVVTIVTLPILIGTGAALKAKYDVKNLYASNATLELENANLKDLLSGLEDRLQTVRSDVDKRNQLAAATPSIWPTHGWLSSSTGNRADPFTGEKDYHPGLDISADKGDPVYATADGKVVNAAAAGNYGNLVIVDHGYGIETRYGHLSAFKVKVGQAVKRGDLLGLVGSTGRATGAHLHYEVRANGRILNPLQLLLNPRRSGAD
jgi:murein DD-endopeptidase MepM/ murein hydrolase activator NlpD